MKYSQDLLKLISEGSLVMNRIRYIELLGRYRNIDIIKVSFKINNLSKLKSASRKNMPYDITKGGICTLFGCIYDNGKMCTKETKYTACPGTMDYYNEVHFFRYMSESSLYLMRYLISHEVIIK